MDTNKNSYTIIYSIVMVVLVAAVLAFVSLSLKDKQNENISNEKKQYLLASVGLGADANFDQVITEAIVVDGNGNVINTANSNIAASEAFNISTSEQASLIKNGAPKDELRLPVFVASLPCGSQAYIFSAYGAGLWGPIWGWVSLKTDLNTKKPKTSCAALRRSKTTWSGKRPWTACCAVTLALAKRKLPCAPHLSA